MGQSVETSSEEIKVVTISSISPWRARRLSQLGARSTGVCYRAQSRRPRSLARVFLGRQRQRKRSSLPSNCRSGWWHAIRPIIKLSFSKIGQFTIQMQRSRGMLCRCGRHPLQRLCSTPVTTITFCVVAARPRSSKFALACQSL